MVKRNRQSKKIIGQCLIPFDMQGHQIQCCMPCMSVHIWMLYIYYNSMILGSFSMSTRPSLLNTPDKRQHILKLKRRACTLSMAVQRKQAKYNTYYKRSKQIFKKILLMIW